jgi:hypothetical protein
MHARAALDRKRHAEPAVVLTCSHNLQAAKPLPFTSSARASLYTTGDGCFLLAASVPRVDRLQ